MGDAREQVADRNRLAIADVEGLAGKSLGTDCGRDQGIGGILHVGQIDDIARPPSINGR